VRPRLCLRTLGAVPPGARPSYDPREVSVGILHLGVGAFHRAHQAVYTDAVLAAGDLRWGIAGASLRSSAVPDVLAPQDGLYGVLERDDAHSSARVVGALRAVAFALRDREELLGWFARPEVSVVTLTVTEKGYRHDPATGRLRLDDPGVAADRAGASPVTVVGLLAAGIARRRAADAGPLSVVCCDNLPRNGATLEGLVTAFCEAAPAYRHLLGWLGEHVAFPSTVVDRIVPAASPDDRAAAASLLGVLDRGTVVTEPFSEWVLEDRFAGPRPAWEVAGARLCDDVAPYETLKLRVMNGVHSSLAYLGGLAGIDYLADAARDADLGAYAAALVDHDIGPTLCPPPDRSVAAYRDAVLRRVANRALRHRTAQVAMDGSQKLPQRLLGTVRDRLAQGAVPRHACLAVAAWMRYVSAGEDEKGRPLALEDPLAPRIRGLVGSALEPSVVVDRLLGLREVFGDDLPDHTPFREALGAALGDLVRHGVRGALRGLLGPEGAA
jgi:fructuronate reductase